jgi:outer membrane protein assembly factor BamA
MPSGFSKPTISFFLFFFSFFGLEAQDTTRHHVARKQTDVIDIGLSILKKDSIVRTDTLSRIPGKVYVAGLPAVGYTLITGWAVGIAANAAFYTSTDADQNVSSILTEPAYTQYKQILLPVQANIWTPHNRFNIQTDWSYKKFPQNTYGLGGEHPLSSGYQIDYRHLRFYQTIFKTVAKDLFVGTGFYFDRYWDIKQDLPADHPPTDFDKYGFTPTAQSSGITLNVLYDLRRNSINPLQGYYANIVYRDNLTFLGSDTHWQSLLIDLRRYISIPGHSKNKLAFWTFNTFTIQGKPPYLSLPFTGCDTYINSGRGYIQGRFRGQSMIYLESEYRFQITADGLLGAVVFANIQSQTEPDTKKFEVFSPGCGGGIRIKLNKFSNTNVAIDYGFGVGGSHGLFVNLGEVF